VHSKLIISHFHLHFLLHSQIWKGERTEQFLGWEMPNLDLEIVLAGNGPPFDVQNGEKYENIVGGQGGKKMPNGMQIWSTQFEPKFTQNSITKPTAQSQ